MIGHIAAWRHEATSVVAVPQAAISSIDSKPANQTGSKNSCHLAVLFHSEKSRLGISRAVIIQITGRTCRSRLAS